jgi:chemotaxis protein histidine kinase CheA
MAAVQARRQEVAARRREEAAAARQASEAAAAQQRDAAIAAAAERERARRATEEEAARRQAAADAEVRRKAEAAEELRRQQAAELLQAQKASEDRRRREAEQAAAEVEARRRAEEAAKAERQRQEAEARREAQEKERRRRVAEEAERRRLAEVERQRLEELRRREEEERRRREELRRRAIQRRFVARWLAEARRRVEVRRVQMRIAADLKACRVAPARAMTFAIHEEEKDDENEERVQAAGEAFGGLHLGPVSTRAAGPSGRRPVDLAALCAPLLARRSPEAKTLYWKVVVVSDGSVGGGPLSASSVCRWLSLVLSGGHLAVSAAGSAFVYGPVLIRKDGMVEEDGGTAEAELTTCALVAPSGAALDANGAVLAGAGGIVAAVGAGVDGDGGALASLLQSLSNLPRIPVLFVSAMQGGADAWVAVASNIAPGVPVSAISIVKASDEAVGPSPVGTFTVGPFTPAFSREQLERGLKWLSANAPPQPSLAVARLENAARDALAARLGTAAAAPEAALEAALNVVAEAARLGL